MKLLAVARTPACPGLPRLALALVSVWAVLCSPPAAAQSLDDQYEYYLRNACENLGFARDASLALLPGQAGPHLAAYCYGNPVQGGSISSSSGGGAGAGETRDQGSEDGAALRRRRERLQEQRAGAAPAADRSDIDVASLGATSVFLSANYRHERQSGTPFEAGRRLHGLDALLGADYHFGRRGLAGLALKYGTQSGDIDSGGDFESRTRGAWAYGSWLPLEGGFVDLAAGIDAERLHTRRIVARQIVMLAPPPLPPRIGYNPPPLPAISDARGRATGAELRAGYDFSWSRAAVGPRAALTLRHAQWDPYLESGVTPMTLAFDAQTMTSLRSLVGIQGSRAFSWRGGVLVPQLNADWVHEYRDDQRVLSAHFAEDLRAAPTGLHIRNNPPDRDWYQLRFGTVAVFAHGFSAFVALEGTAGHAYLERYRASLGVRLEL
jgi:uncharacterized protein YhjY with autotransporter beta-barrel domain